jgi:hypothetical protein
MRFLLICQINQKPYPQLRTSACVQRCYFTKNGGSSCGQCYTQTQRKSSLIFLSLEQSRNIFGELHSAQMTFRSKPGNPYKSKAIACARRALIDSSRVCPQGTSRSTRTAIRRRVATRRSCSTTRPRGCWTATTSSRSTSKKPS